MDEDRREEEIGLLDYLLVLAKRKKLIIGITLSVAIFTAIYSLTLPFIYKAETKILIPQGVKQGIAAQFLSQFGNLIDLVGGTVSSVNPEVIISILKSKPVYDRIIDKFGLMERYKAKNKEVARKRLANVVKAKQQKRAAPIITISVTDKDPKMAADMANAFVEVLKERLQELAVTEAAQKRLFFEEQLKKAKEALIKSEEAMRAFQEKTGVLKVEAQTEAVIESIAKLRAQIAAKEVELKVMRTYSTPYNPDLQRLEETIKGLKIELAKLERKGGGKNPDPLMPTGKMPAVGTEYLRKLREVKFNEKLYELMAQQYEMAKIEEAKDPAIIQVIDKAIPPHKRFKPKRMVMVMIATFTGFFLSIFLAFFMEYIERATQERERREKIEVIKRYLSFRRKK